MRIACAWWVLIIIFHRKDSPLTIPSEVRSPGRQPAGGGHAESVRGLRRDAAEGIEHQHVDEDALPGIGGWIGFRRNNPPNIR